MSQPPPISGTIYGVLLNSRAERARRAESFIRPPYKAPPVAPVLYIKTPNTVLEPGGVVAVPCGVDTLEVNATLAVVFTRATARVASTSALSGVGGCAVAVDVCVPHQEVFRPAIRQRCRDGFLPMQSAFAPIAVLGDLDALDIVTEVDGKEASRFCTADLVRSLPVLISDISQFMTFLPGDILLAGLSADPALARAGQTVTARISGLAAVSFSLSDQPMVTGVAA